MSSRGVEPGRQRTNLLNLARFVVRNPSKAGVMVRKVVDRLFSARKNLATRGNSEWVSAHSEDPADIAHRIAPDLWEEAERFARSTRDRAQQILARVPYDLGGGGDFRFLYWLTRLYRPDVVVETGVAAGWTSEGFLSALEANQQGKLYSSDFPYFRINRPENYIGCVVRPELRARWDLYLDGDAAALPRIISEVPKIDIFHYDSDKSWDGRDKAMELVLTRLSPTGLILIDDILDNDWFRTYVEREGVPFKVIGGRVGLIGELKPRPTGR